MTCDCHSYNWDIGTEPAVVLRFPFDERDVEIDACLVPVIKKLWAAKIPTLASCCGHNRDAPSVLFSCTDYAIQAKPIIQNMDGRRFELNVWLLCTVASTMEAEQ